MRILKTKKIEAMTGGIIGQILGRVHVGTPQDQAVYEVLRRFPPEVLIDPDKQNKIFYATIGAIIQHNRNLQTYLEVMGCLSPAQAKKRVMKISKNTITI